MRLREIQSELKQRKVTYDDCFDRESLVKRLLEAREQHPIQVAEEVESQTEAMDSSPSDIPERHKVQTPSNELLQSFDREATLLKLRGERIKSLREQLSHYNVRWGNMIEKDELVKALCDAMEDRFARSQSFSRSGEVIAGEVCDSNEDALLKELGWLESDLSRGAITPVPKDSKPTSHAPILLDVYATWCGPCQFMSPQFKDAAKEFGPDVRMVKLDSDKYPRIASALKVGGLPTVILFDGGDVSKEIDRIEGALTKDQLVGFVRKHLS
eukprot:scaffold229275_cov75-Cyclotella_meneghiniana.AAC.2